jgi:hypothetical protein
MMRDYIAELDRVLEEIKPAVIVAAWGSSMPQTQQARAAHAGRMALLKLARAAAGTPQRDDYVDGCAYVAFAGEAASRERE